MKIKLFTLLISSFLFAQTPKLSETGPLSVEVGIQYQYSFIYNPQSTSILKMTSLK